jgi:hypothetical protein
LDEKPKSRKTISQLSLVHANKGFRRSGLFSVLLSWHLVSCILLKKWLSRTKCADAHSWHDLTMDSRQLGVAMVHRNWEKSTVSPHKKLSGMLPTLDDATTSLLLT